MPSGNEIWSAKRTSQEKHFSCKIVRGGETIEMEHMHQYYKRL